MLRQVAQGVLIHQSEFLESNAVVVQGRAGVLLIDPGIQGSEMAALAQDLGELGQPVVARTLPDFGVMFERTAADLKATAERQASASTS